MIALRRSTAARLAAALFSIPLGIEAQAPAGGEVALSASRLELSPDGDRIEAAGGVLLTAGDLELRAPRAELRIAEGVVVIDAPFELSALGLELRAASGEISRGGSAFRLERPAILKTTGGPPFALGGEELRCDAGSCSVARGFGTACPHHPPGYRIEADEIELHPSGDIDLTKPALRIGDAKIAVLPWLRIRPPEKPGFFAPRLGYSRRAGLIAGPAGYLPLGEAAYADGYVAARTAAGFEDGTHLRTSSADLRVEHVFSAPDDNAGRARLSFAEDLRGGAIAVEADAVSDRRFLSDTTFEPLEKAVSRAESRALISLPGDRVLWESSFAAGQPLVVGAADGIPGFETRASLHGALVAAPNAAHLWPGLEIGLDRRDTVGDVAPYDARGAYAAPHTRFFAKPSLSAPFDAGPFSIRIGAESRHVVWLVDGASGDAPSRTDLGGSAVVELPLAGRLFGRDHILAPRLAYRVTPLVLGASPPFAFDGLDRAREAHAVEAGFDTSLDPFLRWPLAEMSVLERAYLPGFSEERGAFLAAKLRVGARPLGVHGEVAWDQRRESVSAASAGLSSEDERGDLIAVDARWYGPGDGPHLDGMWAGGDGAWLGDGGWLGGSGERLELAERAGAAVARFVVLSAGARVEVVPRPGLNALWYGLALRSECGCAELGLRAAHRLDTWVPDLMLTFVLK